MIVAQGERRRNATLGKASPEFSPLLRLGGEGVGGEEVATVVPGSVRIDSLP